MYKDVGKRILAVMLCICMLVAMGTVSNLTSMAEGEAEEPKLTVKPEKFEIDYDGVGHFPDIQVFYEGNEITDKSKYTVSIQNGVQDVAGDKISAADLPSDAGVYSATIKYTNDAGEESSCPYMFSITPKHIIDDTRVVDDKDEDDPTKICVGEEVTLDKLVRLYDTVITNADGTPYQLKGKTEAEYRTDSSNCDFIYSLSGGAVGQPAGSAGSKITVTVRGCNNYGLSFTSKPNSFTREITIQPKAFGNVRWDNLTFPYTYDYDNNKEKAQHPALTVTGIDGTELKPSAEDPTNGYDVTYYKLTPKGEIDGGPISEEAITAAGKYGLRVTGRGEYAGTESELIIFKITKELKDPDIHVNYTDLHIYSGLKITPEDVVIRDNGNVIPGEYYNVEVWGDSTEANQQNDSYTIIIRATDDVYIGALNNYGFKIQPIKLEDLGRENIKVQSKEGGPVYYSPTFTPGGINSVTNKMLIPDVKLTYNHPVKGVIEIPDDFYNVTFMNDTAIGDNAIALIEAKSHNLSGRVTGTFAIERRPLTPDMIELNLDQFDYDGTERRPEVTVRVDGVVLVKDTDYTLDYSPAVNPGSNPQVTVTGIGNYTGTATKSYTINPADIATLNGLYIDIKNAEYTGTEVMPEVTITYVNSKGDTVTLIKNRDFEVIKAGDPTAIDYDYINVGTGKKILIRGAGNYTGQIGDSFAIVKKSLENNVRVKLDPTEAIYSGKPIEPKVTLYDSANRVISDDEYTCAYANNTNVGTAAITITAKADGNFSGTIKANFEIKPQAITADNIEVEVRRKSDTAGEWKLIGEVEFDYLGVSVDPSREYDINVYCRTGQGRLLLKETADYAPIKFSNNEKPGTGKMEIRAIESFPDGRKGNFTGSAEVGFSIKGRLANAVIEAEPQEYTGGVIDIRNGNGVTVTYGDSITLEYGKDYKIEYIDGEDYTNVNAACRFNIVPGSNGAYTGSKEGTFAITKKKLTAEDIKINVPDQTYTGKPIDLTELKKVMTITCNGTTVLEADQFSVVFIDTTPEGQTNANDEVGLRVTVTAPDANYEGSRNITFKILKRQLTEENTDIVINKSQKVKLVDQESISFTTDPYSVSNTVLPIDVTYTGEGLSPDAELTFDIEGEYSAVGEQTLTIQGNGNFEGTVTKTFTVYGDLEAGLKADWRENDKVTKIEYDAEPEFNGGETKPEVTISYRGKELTEDEIATNFDIIYGGVNTKVTEYLGKDETAPSITIAPKMDGYYLGSAVVREYDIKKCDIAKAFERGDIKVTILNPETIVYNGSEQKPGIEITQNGYEINPDLFEISYENNVQGRREDGENPPTVILTAPDGSNYTGEIRKPFTIRGVNFDNYDVEIRFTGNVQNGGQTLTDVDMTKPLVFNGLPYIPEIVITATPKGGGDPLELHEFDENGENQDYKIVSSPADYINAGTVTIEIEGWNNFEGKLTKTFVIDSKMITINPDEYAIDIEPEQYTSVAVQPAHVTVIDLTRDASVLPASSLYTAYADNASRGYELVRGTDYEVPPATNNINAGTATAFIEGQNNYRGTVTGNFDITPLDLGSNTVSVSKIPAQTYTGAQIQLAPDKVEVYVTAGGKQIKLNDGYQVEAGDKLNVGEGVATIKPANGNQNLTGRKVVHFEIVPKKLSDADITYKPESIEDQVFNGSAIEPEIDIYFGERRLKAGEDYTLGYEANDKCGTGYVIANGKGNFSDKLRVPFRIIRDINSQDLKVDPIDAQTYTGKEIKPKPAISLNGKKLTEGTDYELSYTDNVGPGTATVTITGIGAEYGGEKKVTFMILRDINSIEIPALSSKIYTGKEIQAVPKIITEDGKALKEGEDFTLSYKNNTNTGTAAVTITGKGLYIGSKECTFRILPRSLSQCQIGSVADMIYNGKPAIPAVTVTDPALSDVRAAGGLKENVDYTLEYVNNKKPGTARVIISGKGNYTGNRVVTYKVNIAEISGLKATVNSSKKATLNWNANAAVTGYEIYGAGDARIARTDKNSCTLSGLKSNTTYTYRVRSYTIVGGQVYYSHFSKVTVTTR